MPSNPPIWTPTPDPTLLTTAALQREVAGLRELYDSRLHDRDRAISLLQAQADRVPSIAVIEERVRALTTLMEEKFKGIATQFIERDVAVSAALQAAKEAVAEQNRSSAMAIAKSEAATAKQIDQLGVAFSATTSGITDKIDDIKDRITTIEGGGAGRHQAWGYLIGAIGALTAVTVAVISFIK